MVTLPTEDFSTFCESLFSQEHPLLREHTTTIRVRYDETDPMGFCHHANYLRYMEIGRTDLLRASGGSYRAMEERGEMVVVVRIDCRYHAPAKYDDLISVHTKIAKVTMAKIIHEYVISRDGGMLFTATVTLAVIDRSGKLQRVPQALLDAYGIDDA